MSKAPCYVTTPIYYVNDQPHVGHAYTTVTTDFLARWHRSDGHDTWFLTGTDEHGEKVNNAAAEAGRETQAFVDQVSRRFRDAWQALDISHDDFIRTTEERHKRVVRAILQRIHDAGDVYYGEYEGLYSVGQERYVGEDELVDGKLPEDRDPPVLRREGNYFFRMEKYRHWLRDFLEANPGWIHPAGYRSEMLGLLRAPVGDLSISRPRDRLPWGIGLPWDDSHVTYVWCDALINYVSALGYPDDPRYRTFWPRTWHLIGKDILRQHAMFWPTMLKSAGLPLPERILVGGYLSGSDGRKMSKSLGNVLDPFQLADRYGTDAVRYYLLRILPYGNDGNAGEAGLVERYNADLANDLGNLLSRTLTLVNRHLDGAVGAPRPGPAEREVQEHADGLADAVRGLIAGMRLNGALEEVMQFVRRLNRYFNDRQPWALAKDPQARERLETVLYTAVEGLRLAAVLLAPAMPAKTATLLSALGLQPQSVRDGARWGLTPPGATVDPDPPVLFPRIGSVPRIDSGARIDAGGRTGAGTRPRTAKPATERSGPERSGAKPSEPPKPTRKEPAVSDNLITFEDFGRVDMRVAEVLTAERVPKTDRLLKLGIRIGDEERTVVAGIAAWYEAEQMVGRKIVVVANLKPAKLRGIVSQGMLLAAEDDAGNLALLEVPPDTASGARVK